MSLKQDFESIIGQFKSRTEYQNHLKQIEKIYELKVYRVGSMTRQQALTCYRQLQFKYLNGVYQHVSTGWHENERRLFVWFMVCYSKWNKINVNQQHVWDQLSGIFFNKDPRLLKYQFMNVLKRKSRVQWTVQQDELLRESYNRHPNSEWNQIAKELFFLYPMSKTFKTPKSCRQRWNNHLNNEVKKQPFTQEQDRQLLVNIKQKGKKWSVIAKEMGSKRTQHQIKNRWNSLVGQFIKSLMNGTNSNNIINSNNSSNNQIGEDNEQKRSVHNNNFEGNNNDKDVLTGGGQLNEQDILQRLLVEIENRLQTKTLSQQFNHQITPNHSTRIINNPNFTNPLFSTQPQLNTTTSPSPPSTTHHLLSNNPIITHTHFPFLSTINVVTEHETQFKFQHQPSQSINNCNFIHTNHQPIFIKSTFDSNLNQQDKKQFNQLAMKFINCGSNKINVLDKDMAAAIEDKLFGSISQYRSDISWMDKNFLQTPCGFFEQSICQQKKMSEFKLSRPNSFQNSQLANSIQMFKLPQSDMSQEYRVLTSSMTIDTRGSSSMNYQFASDLKQL